MSTLGKAKRPRVCFKFLQTWRPGHERCLPWRRICQIGGQALVAQARRVTVRANEAQVQQIWFAGREWRDYYLQSRAKRRTVPEGHGHDFAGQVSGNVPHRGVDDGTWLMHLRLAIHYCGMW